jgi:rod shape-determining protein MreD
LIAVFSAATLIALAIQTSLMPLLPFSMLMPDFALILAVNLGLRHTGAAAALMAFGIGYATDAFSGNQLGLNALLFTLVFIVTYWLSHSMFSVSSIVGIVAVFAGVILIDFGDYVAASGRNSSTALGVLLPSILIQAAITALCAPAVFRLIARVTRIVGLRPRGARR